MSCSFAAAGSLPLVCSSLLIACSLGCGSPRPEPVESPKPPPCSLAHLLAFDPGLEVVERRPLPTALQRSAARTEHLVVVACDDEESDQSCQARAEREVTAAHPAAVELSTEIIAEELSWHARYLVDGVEQQQVFANTDELVAELQGLRDEGRQVVVLEGRAEPTADSPRDALVRAVGAPSGSGHENLRLELRLVLPDDEARVLPQVQRRALGQALLIHSWEPRDDRTLRLEIGCVRPLAVTPSEATEGPR